MASSSNYSYAIINEVQFKVGGNWLINSMTSGSTGSIGSYSPLISSGTFSDPFRAFDGNSGLQTGYVYTYSANGTSYDENVAGAYFLKVDFGSGNYLDVTGVRLKSGFRGSSLSDSTTYGSVDRFYVQGSNDDSNWVTLSPNPISSVTTDTMAFTWGGSDPATPPNPTGISPTPTGSSSMLVSWSPAGGTTASYYVAYSLDSYTLPDCGASIRARVETTNTSVTVSGLRGGASHKFRVCAVNADGVASAGALISELTNPPGLPSIPTITSVTQNTETSVNMAVTSPGGDTTGFKVVYTAGSTAPADCNSGTLYNTLAYDFSSGVGIGGIGYNEFLPNSTYSFRVCGLNDVLQQSAGVTQTFTLSNSCPNTINGLSFTCNCSASQASTNGASVFGSNPYVPYLSHLCRAAVHAGIITTAGGDIKTMYLGGVASFTASTANGQASSSYGPYFGTSISVP